MQPIIIIAAVAENNVIGKDGKIPWHISEDFQQFKEHTSGKVCIMGLNTFISLGNKPLPNRTNIILTKEPLNRDDIIEVFSVDEALEKARTYNKEIFICGGAMVYHTFMPLADKLYISHVKGEYEGDTFFPEIDLKIWKPVKIKGYKDFKFVEYEKATNVQDK